jgi:hypothetical protein
MNTNDVPEILFQLIIKRGKPKSAALKIGGRQVNQHAQLSIFDGSARSLSVHLCNFKGEMIEVTHSERC